MRTCLAWTKLVNGCARAWSGEKQRRRNLLGLARFPFFISRIRPHHLFPDCSMLITLNSVNTNKRCLFATCQSDGTMSHKFQPYSAVKLRWCVLLRESLRMTVPIRLQDVYSSGERCPDCIRISECVSAQWIWLYWIFCRTYLCLERVLDFWLLFCYCSYGWPVRQFTKVTMKNRLVTRISDSTRLHFIHILE